MKLVGRLISIMALATSCSGEFIDITTADISISPYLNFPIGSVNVTMSNVVPDTGLIKLDSNKFYIKYSIDSALTLYADSLLPELPSIMFGDSTSIANVVLPNFSQATDFTLGDFGPTSNLTGGLFIFPAIAPVYGGSQTVQGNSPICSATVSQGTISLTVTNSWPISVQLNLALVDNTTGATVTNFIFPPILPGSSSSQTKSLLGKTVSNNMSLDIINIQSPGSNGVPVPYTPNDAISFLMQSNGIEVGSGSVVFPQSQLFASSDFVDFGLSNGIRLKYVNVKRAVIRYEVASPLNGVIQTDVSIPYSDNFGAEFGFTVVSTPASPVTLGRVVMQNVTLDLSKMPGMPFNRLPIEVESSLSNPASCIGFSSAQELKYIFELDSIEIDAVEGQFGVYSFDLSQGFDLDDIDLGLDYDEFIFYGPRLALDFKNSIGVPVFLDLNLTSQNTYGSFSEQVSDFAINYPNANVFPLLRETTLIVRPDTTDPFIVLPNQTLIVDVEAKIQSSGNPQPAHFIQSGEDLNIDVSLIQESRFGVSNLRFVDTIAVTPPDSSVLSNILEAFWGVAYTNGLPLGIMLSIDALDASNGVLFSKSIALDDLVGETRLDLSNVEVGSLGSLSSIVWSVRFDSLTGENKLLNGTDKLELNLSLGGRLKLEVL